MLEVAGVPYRDVGREEGLDSVLPLYKQEAKTAFPVLFPPYLRHNGSIMNQLEAIILYIANLNGLVPEDPIEAAHAHQIMCTLIDILREALDAYHP